MREPESVDVHGVGPSNEAGVVRFAGLAFDPAACTLARESGEAILLTRGELALLRVFVARPGRVLSRDTLLNALSNRSFQPFDRSVDVLVGKLRRKIEPDLKQPCLIITVPGEGYRFDGLTKPQPSDQKLSTKALSLQDAERREPDWGSPSPSEELAERKMAAAEAKPARSATPGPDQQAADRTRAPAAKPRFGSAALAAALAALLLFAAAGAWVLLGGRATTRAQAGHLSLVVLPFANLSGDPGQDYFADGITDNLTTELSRARDSFVIARNTAFIYKGKNIDAKEIGKELGVRYVLEGSVQRDQNRVRVNAQLVDAESGAHLWADQFQEDMADLFKLEDEVVARLGRSLNLAMEKAEAEKGGRSKNPDVIDLSMRGFDLLTRAVPQPPKEHRESIRQARTLFDRALQIDPNYADALAGSAETYFNERLSGWGDPGTDYEAKVLGQTNRAIGLDPDNPYVYYPKALYLALSGRPSEALGAADAGLAVDPNFVLLYLPRAIAENSLGRFQEAKADAERAMRLSPRDPAVAVLHVNVGDAELGLGHFEAAIDEFHKALESGLRMAFVYTNLSAAYAHAGKMDEAKAALEEARRLNPNLTVRWMTEHMPNLPAVLEGVRKAGLPEE
jgi:adenylate cyclase